MAVKSNRVPAIREPRDTVKEMHRSREVSVEEWQWPSVESVDQTHQGPSIGDWLQSISALRGAKMLSWKNKMLHCLLPHRHAHPHTYKHIYKHIMCQDADKQKQTFTHKQNSTICICLWQVRNKQPAIYVHTQKAHSYTNVSTENATTYTPTTHWIPHLNTHVHRCRTIFW